MLLTADGGGPGSPLKEMGRSKGGAHNRVCFASVLSAKLSPTLFCVFGSSCPDLRLLFEKCGFSSLWRSIYFSQ